MSTVGVVRIGSRGGEGCWVGLKNVVVVEGVLGAGRFFHGEVVCGSSFLVFLVSCLFLLLFRSGIVQNRAKWPY